MKILDKTINKKAYIRLRTITAKRVEVARVLKKGKNTIKIKYSSVAFSSFVNILSWSALFLFCRYNT